MTTNLYTKKHFRYFIIVMMILLNGISNQSKAQLVLVPDSNFRAALIAKGFGGCITGNYIDSTCALVRNSNNLSIYGQSIQDITGIEAFVNLYGLTIDQTLITTLPPLPNHIGALFLNGMSLLTNITSFPDSLKIFNIFGSSITSFPTFPNLLSAIYINSLYLNSFPTFPDSLKVLYYEGCNLTSIPSLPVSLQQLSVFNNHLTTLPILSTKLNNLNCSLNNITSLPTLPNGLYEIDCSYNQLTSLPSIPTSLRILNCCYNQITFLQALPKRLYKLDCASNQITSLTLSTSDSLISLVCRNNQLTTLPSFANVLKILDCSTNQITSLPSLGDSLTDFSCSSNKILTIPALPNTLQSLICSGNLLNNIPTLPLSLKYLNCNYNPISILPTLPKSLRQLTCYQNLISYLPALPNLLNYLDCSKNQISTLPVLPDSLKTLLCSYNIITTLPILPNNHFSDLRFSYNNINFIPNTPDSVDILDCSHNPNLSCLPILKHVNTLIFKNTNITCLPDYGSIVYSDPLLSTVPLCGIFNPFSCNSFWNISGKTYFDADTNCTYNNGDNSQNNFKLNLYKNGSLIQQAFTGKEGYYSFDTDSLGVYKTILDTNNIPFEVRCPASFTYSDTLIINDTLKYDRDFSLKCKNGFDLAVSSIYANSFRPAHNVNVNVNAGDYSNLFGAHCASGISGTVTIIFNGAVSYVGPMNWALSPTSINGDTLTYIVADFGTVNFDSSFNFLLAVDTSAIIGSQVCISVAISPGSDNNPTNNFISQCFTVRGSFDPNEKTVRPENTVDINGDRWLTYTVSFQNTGTAAAEHIYITDTLDANLDWSSFQLLAYSHQPYVQILEGGVAKFNFPNINLPDSVSNEPLSHGYVQYKIKAKDSIAAGVQISNTANIYFDFNAPVITNTVTNSVINCGQNIQTSYVSICDGETYNFNGLTLTAAGNFSQKFVSSSGCDSIISLNLQVNPKYSSSISETICGGDFYQFNGQNLMLPGVYTFNSATTLGCDSTIILTLNVDQINTTVSQMQDTLFAFTPNATYQWINCITGNIIAGATSQNYSPTTSGNYAVIITSGNCTDTSSCHYLSLTGINENYSNEIQISPNPSSNEFVVYCPQQLVGKQVAINIYDAYGKLVDERKLTSVSTIIKAGNWAKGIYFMQVNSEGNVVVRKLVKN